MIETNRSIFTLALLVLVLIQLAVLVGGAYVAVHFIVKWW